MKKILSLSLTISIISGGIFLAFEPEIARGVGDTITVTQTVTAEISISAPTDVTMSPSLAGITGGTATGSATWTVITSDSSGFNMTIYASVSPALVGATQGDSIANYTEASAGVPDYTWSVAESDAEFGFSVEPATAADADPSFLDNGTTTCNTGATQTTDKCWLDLPTSGTPETIINRSSETTIAGEAEAVKFTTEINGPATDADGYVIEDSYTATVTVTAVTN